MSMTNKLKHGEALAQYLALGADRSLEKLHCWLTERSPEAPCLRTLKAWSTKYGWQAEAAEYDARVSAQLVAKAEAAAVEHGVDHVQALTEVADKALQKALAGLDAEHIKADTTYELAALVNSALGAIKGVQLLTGKATERFSDAVKDQAPEWILDKLSAMTAPATASSDEIGDEIDMPIPESATHH